MQEFSFADAEARGFKWDFQVDELTVLGYTGQVIAWIRCCLLAEPGEGGFDGVDYYANNVLLFDSIRENWAAEQIVGYEGQGLLDVLKTRLDADPESEAFKTAYKTVWRLLTESSMQKVAHGKRLLKKPALGALLDLEENRDADVEPGTFAELLRYGSVHFEQTRTEIAYVDAVRPEERMIIRKGLLEA